MNSGVTEQQTVVCGAETGAGGKKKRLGIYDVIIRLVGILPSRAQLSVGIAPFGVAFLTMERRFTPGAVVSALVSAVGYISLLDLPLAVRIYSAAKFRLDIVCQGHTLPFRAIKNLRPGVFTVGKCVLMDAKQNGTFCFIHHSDPLPQI